VGKPHPEAGDRPNEGGGGEVNGRAKEALGGQRQEQRALESRGLGQGQRGWRRVGAPHCKEARAGWLPAAFLFLKVKPVFIMKN
jgi:hypothetical protein